jgi:hypothetical protein
MQLLASWKQSLSIFYPLNNLKLFGFAILRAVQVAVPQFFKMFWWLVGISVLCDYFWLSADLVLTPLIMVCIYLIVRPSVGLKNLTYVKEHWRALFFAGLLSLILSSGSLVLSGVETFIIDDSSSLIARFLVAVFAISAVVLLNILFVLLPLWLFFFFDSRATIGSFFVSWKRAFLMAVYALPVWLTLFIMLEGLYWLLELVSVEGSFLKSFWMMLLWVCVQIVVACAWSVFYTKRLHEQFELYFPGPQIQE